MAAHPVSSFEPWQQQQATALVQASAAPVKDGMIEIFQHAAQPWGVLADRSPREQEEAKEERRGSTSLLDSSANVVAATKATLAEAEARLSQLEEQLRAAETQGRAAAAAAEAEIAQALALEEELRTARELIEENGGMYDEAFVGRVLTEHAQLKAQVNESTEALVEATQAGEEEGGSEQGCLQGVLRLKGVGFVEYGEVERALQKDHLSKEAVEALFDAVGGLITDASFEVLQRRMGEIVGEDREAVRSRLAAVPLTGKKRPRPEAMDALVSLFVTKRREMEEANPSGVYASYKLWAPAAGGGREQTLAEAVRAVVGAHGQLWAQLAAAKAENAALRRQLGMQGRGRSVSPVPGTTRGGGRVAHRGRSRSPLPPSGGRMMGR